MRVSFLKASSALPPPPSPCTIRERLSHVLGFHSGIPLGLLVCQVMTGVMSNARLDQAPAGKLLISGSGLVHF